MSANNNNNSAPPDDDDEQLKLLIAESNNATENADTVAADNDKHAEPHQQQQQQTTNLELVNSFKLRSALITSMKDTKTTHVQVPDKLSAAVADVPQDLQVDEHMVELQELCARLNSSHTMGMDPQQAKQRLAKDGPNTLVIKNYKWILNVIGYFFGGLTLLLWPASILSILAYKPLGGDNPDIANLGLGIILILVILAQGFFSMYQEWSSSKVMDSIKKMMPQATSAVRNGEECKIATADIVVGDVVKLETGEKVSADVRLIECQQLKVDNSILTGESEPISCTLHYTDTNYMETKNLVFMGSSIVEGTGLGIVIATGNRTVMGKVAKLASSTTKGASTLRTQANHLVIGVAIFGFVSVVALLLYWGLLLRPSFPRFMSVPAVITNCIGLLVVFVPEGLPVALTLTLTVIAQRMYRENVLVKSLPTVETLGAIDFIASDKTGTLTQNKMSVAQVYSAFRLLLVKDCYRLYEQNDAAFQELVTALCVCNRARYESSSNSSNDNSVNAPPPPPVAERKILGDASDTAFLQFSEQFFKSTSVRAQYNKIAEIPFHSKNKWMLSIVQQQQAQQYTLMMKGASELMIHRCSTVLNDQGAEIPLTNDMKDVIMKQIEDLCNDGKRVLAAARLKLNAEQYPLGYEFNTEERNFPTEGLCFLGLAALFDPPRDDVEQAVQKCKTAGIRVMMVTGDHDKTAAAIAKMIAIITKDQMYQPFNLNANVPIEEMKQQDPDMQRPLVIRGEHVPKFNKDQWDYVFLHDEIVFARTTPEHKLIIVRECQARKHVVAATGDGVNDAPALKQANVGVAMGEGSDVAKEAADIVLMDNRFSSIVRGIERGRLVFDNLKKLIVYLMTAGNYAEMIPIVLHAFLGLPLPLSSFLMICICVATDMAPSLTLIFEQPEGDLMLRKPYIQTGERLIDFGWFVQTFVFLGSLECIGALGCYFIYFYMYAKISPLDLFLVFDDYQNGYKGLTQAQLDNFLFNAQTIYFVAIVIIQCFNLMSTRTRRLSFFQQFPLFKKSTKNPTLFLGITISVSLALFIVYLPIFNTLFNTRPIPIEFWFWPMTFGLLMFILDDIRKWVLQLLRFGYAKVRKHHSNNNSSANATAAQI